MTKNQIHKFDKAKDAKEEIPKDESNKQQSKEYLPAYLRKIEDEKDVPENTIEELVEINLDPGDSNKTVLVGVQLTEIEKKEMIECLKRNKDVFAWSHKDIPGVNPEEAEHCLNIDLSHPPVRQK